MRDLPAPLRTFAKNAIKGWQRWIIIRTISWAGLAFVFLTAAILLMPAGINLTIYRIVYALFCIAAALLEIRVNRLTDAARDNTVRLFAALSNKDLATLIGDLYTGSAFACAALARHAREGDRQALAILAGQDYRLPQNVSSWSRDHKAITTVRLRVDDLNPFTVRINHRTQAGFVVVKWILLWLVSLDIEFMVHLDAQMGRLLIGVLVAVLPDIIQRFLATIPGRSKIQSLDDDALLATWIAAPTLLRPSIEKEITRRANLSTKAARTFAQLRFI